MAPGTAATSSAAPTSTSEATRPSIAAVGGRGLIAATGPTGLRFLTGDGRPLAEWANDLLVTQPTWSRDGRRLVATVVDPDSGAASVAVIDVSTWQIEASQAGRPYFFYSWSHDGTRLAALGPGGSGGTSLDILDTTGRPASNVSLESDSMYVAWEPGGDRLLIHAGAQLRLLADPDSPQEHTDFGSVGFGFQAPAWVPGTSDFLYVNSLAPSPRTGSDAGPSEAGSEEAIAFSGPRLVRRSADSGELTDLGGAEGLAMMSVHPEGVSPPCRWWTYRPLPRVRMAARMRPPPHRRTRLRLSRTSPAARCGSSTSTLASAPRCSTAWGTGSNGATTVAAC